MFKNQLDVLCAVLNYCYELSGNSDSLTDCENNKVFAGLVIDNERYAQLHLYGGHDMDGQYFVCIDLNESAKDCIEQIERESTYVNE